MRNHYTVVGNVHKLSHYRNQGEISSKKINKLKRELSYDLDISVLGIDSSDSVSANHTTTYAFMFVIISRITKLQVSSM